MSQGALGQISCQAVNSDGAGPTLRESRTPFYAPRLSMPEPVIGARDTTSLYLVIPCPIRIRRNAETQRKLLCENIL